MSKTTVPNARTQRKANAPAKFSADLSSASQTRICFTGGASLCEKRRVSDEVRQNPQREKRNARFTVALSASEKATLDRLAREERLETGQKARNIVLDFLEGKLIRKPEEATV